MKSLTARQQQILELIRTSVRIAGRPPTRAEIAKEFGFRSANAAEEHLQALAKKGAIVIDQGTSRGIRLLGNDVVDGVDTFNGLSHMVSANLMQLPLIGRVAAGSPTLAQEHIEATYPIDIALFEKKPDYLLRVRGMSMRDIGILEGDFLAVQKTNQANHGQIIVARINDDVTVKRYSNRNGHIQLIAENPDFLPIQIDPNRDQFVIEGLAVGLVRTGQLG